MKYPDQLCHPDAQALWNILQSSTRHVSPLSNSCWIRNSKIHILNWTNKQTVLFQGRGRGWVLEAEEQLGRGLGGGRIHEDSPGVGPLQSGHIHLPPSVRLMLNSFILC